MIHYISISATGLMMLTTLIYSLHLTDGPPESFFIALMMTAVAEVSAVTCLSTETFFRFDFRHM